MVLLAPLPFGAVTAAGRGALEIGALVLGLIWTAHAAVRGTGLPHGSARLGIAGLLLLGIVQALPIGAGIVGAISPNALLERRASIPSGTALAKGSAARRVESTSCQEIPELPTE